jgi:phosphopantothenoylcysteine decarboxylase
LLDALCNLLIGVTGSVAAIKIQELIDSIVRKALEKSLPVTIRVILTHTASNFVSSVKHVERVYSDNADWDSENAWKQKGDPVLHIELRKWADVMLIAPLSAHTLAKISNGLCDTLLTCVCRAWDFQKSFIVCPAMNTLMWKHPLTQKQLSVIRDELKVEVIEPEESKILACGDVGVGAMRNLEYIANKIIDSVRRVGDRP